MFMQCVAGCCTSNFLALFLKERGLSETQIGWVGGLVAPAAAMVGSPLWTAVADCTRRPKATLMLSLGMETLTLTSLLVAPAAFGPLAAVVGGVFCWAALRTRWWIALC